jgi:hypothetical protein
MRGLGMIVPVVEGRPCLLMMFDMGYGWTVLGNVSAADIVVAAAVVVMIAVLSERRQRQEQQRRKNCGEQFHWASSTA